MNFLELFKRLRQWIVDIWERTEKRDRNRFFVITGVAMAVIVIAVVLLTRTKWVNLIGDLDDTSSTEVTTALAANQISYQTTDNGATVLVPEKNRAVAAQLLAAGNIPSTGISYELFAKAQGLTATQFEKNAYEKFQLQSDIAANLRLAFPGIKTARVLLAIPQQKASIYKANAQPVTASVYLTMKDGEAADREFADAVGAAVATAVVGLVPANITVASEGTVLNPNYEDIYGSLKDSYEFELRYESDLLTPVSNLLRDVLGEENFKIACDVELDFDSVSEVQNIVEPVVDENGILQSRQTIHEEANGGKVPAGEPGEDENGGGDTYDEVDSEAASNYIKDTETVNYLVTEITKQITRAKGTRKKLTFSLAVNQLVYENTKAMTEALQSTIGGAIGLRAEDYSDISITYMDFKGAEAEKAEFDKLAKEAKTKELLEMIKIIVIYALIAACVIVIVLKTFQILNKKAETEDVALKKISEIDEIRDELENLNAIGETVKSQALTRVEDFIEKNPSAVAELLRNWLNEDEGRRYF